MKRKLQVGDFVKDGYPNRSRHVPDRHGFIIEAVSVYWFDSELRTTERKNMLPDNYEVISEGR